MGALSLCSFFFSPFCWVLCLMKFASVITNITICNNKGKNIRMKSTPVLVSFSYQKSDSWCFTKWVPSILYSLLYDLVRSYFTWVIILSLSLSLSFVMWRQNPKGDFSAPFFGKCCKWHCILQGCILFF